MAPKRFRNTYKEAYISKIGHIIWNEVKYFHPEGKGMPNGSYYQRGGFLLECKQNTNTFVLDESVYNNDMVQCRGGIIVFPTDAGRELNRNELSNKIDQVITTYKNRYNRHSIIQNVINLFKGESDEYIGTYNVGNYFRGSYVGCNGKTYNDKSLAIEINGLSNKSLQKVAELVAQELLLETVLVKDLNK